MPAHAEFNYIDSRAVLTLRSECGNIYIYQEHLAQYLLSFDSINPALVLVGHCPRRAKLRDWTSELESFAHMKSFLHCGDM